MKRRNTNTKNEIYNLLEASESAMSHDMIQQAVLQNIDRVTIYRILNSFCEDGIVHMIIADDGKQYFAFCRNCTGSDHKHNHFHFRCTVCNSVKCLPMEINIDLPCGYIRHSFNCTISGLCEKCSNNKMNN